MGKIGNLAFCGLSLAAMVALSWLLYPLAARPQNEVAYASTPQGAELFDDVDMGDFGEVPVLDMMQYYIDSPPAAPAAGERKVRFQGC